MKAVGSAQRCSLAEVSADKPGPTSQTISISSRSRSQSVTSQPVQRVADGGGSTPDGARNPTARNAHQRRFYRYRIPRVDAVCQWLNGLTVCSRAASVSHRQALVYDQHRCWSGNWGLS